MSAIGQKRSPRPRGLTDVRVRLEAELLMGFFYPRRIDGSIESNDRVHAAMWADRSLVAVAPVRYRSRWKLAKAVKADRNFAGEQLLSVQGRSTRFSHVSTPAGDGRIVRCQSLLWVASVRLVAAAFGQERTFADACKPLTRSKRATVLLGTLF